jgi:hypothetical protein
MKIVKGLEFPGMRFSEQRRLRLRRTRAVTANAPAEVTTALAVLDSVIDAVAGDTATASQFQLAAVRAGAVFVNVNAALVTQLKTQDYADQAPTPRCWRAGRNRVRCWARRCGGGSSGDGRSPEVHRSAAAKSDLVVGCVRQRSGGASRAARFAWLAYRGSLVRRDVRRATMAMLPNCRQHCRLLALWTPRRTPRPA